jgi:hypothetical protein
MLQWNLILTVGDSRTLAACTPYARLAGLQASPGRVVYSDFMLSPTKAVIPNHNRIISVLTLSVSMTAESMQDPLCRSPCSQDSRKSHNYISRKGCTGCSSLALDPFIAALPV